MKSTKLVLFLLFGVYLTGCSELPVNPSNGNYLSSSFQIPSQGSKIIVLPLQLQQSLKKIISNGQSIIEEEIKNQLLNMGYKVQFISEQELSPLWKEATNSVGDIYDSYSGQKNLSNYEKAMMLLVAKIEEHSGGKLILIPSLVTRDAKLSYDCLAEWDGIKQNMYMDRADNFTYTTQHCTGNVPALSVELSAIDPKSKKLQFKRYGGLSLFYRAINSNKIKPIDDLFGNRSNRLVASLKNNQLAI